MAAWARACSSGLRNWPWAWNFDLAVVCGMAEGTFPARRNDDALLPDRERRVVGRDLPARGDRSGDDHRALLAVIAAARRTVLLYPRGDLRRAADRWAEPVADRAGRQPRGGAVLRGRAAPDRFPCPRSRVRRKVPARLALRPRPRRQRPSGRLDPAPQCAQARRAAPGHRAAPGPPVFEADPVRRQPGRRRPPGSRPPPPGRRRPGDVGVPVWRPGPGALIATSCATC